MKWLFLLLFPISLFALDCAPQYLYKVVSCHNWVESQGRPVLKLTDMDADFIHLAAENQLEHVITKFWSTVDEFVILKLETAKLKGRLEYEANPGGTTQYYHLYNGTIPREAVVEAKIVRRDQTGNFISY